MQVGLDIIEIERFKKFLNNDNLLKRIFTEAEIKYINSYKYPLEHIAGIFSAKEAVCKAFQTGFNHIFTPQNIEILHENKIPYVNLLDKAKDFFDKSEFIKISISISHTKKIASAICLLE